MKKLILILSVITITLGMSSCKGYDIDKCKALIEKSHDSESLTQDDYAEMISQAKGLNKFLCDLKDQLSDKLKDKDVESAAKLVDAAEDESKCYDKLHNKLERANRKGRLNSSNQDAFLELEEANNKLKSKHKENIKHLFEPSDESFEDIVPSDESLDSL